MRTRVLGAVRLGIVAALLSACGPQAGDGADLDQVDAIGAPDLGGCRLLDVDDISEASNASRTVDCGDEHTAQTYAVGQLPGEFDDADYDSAALGRFAFATCSDKLEKFLGADESLAMRTILSWAWFRPSESAWDEGRTLVPLRRRRRQRGDPSR